MSDYRKYRYTREDLQDKAANYVRDKMKMEKKDPMKGINDNMRNQGKLFFVSGSFLEDAPSELRNNSHFIQGYMDAKNRKQEVYDLRVKNFIDGVKFEDLSSIYQNNADFMQGYRDARDLSLVDGIDWRNIPDEFIEKAGCELDNHHESLDGRRHR